MYTRLTQFTLVATLGMLLSVAFAGMAVAAENVKEPVLSFSISQPSTVVPSTVTVTDTSSNPYSQELTYEWNKNSPYFGDINPIVEPNIRAGSPECLNAQCSQARWTYDSPGTYQIEERVSWPGGSSFIFQKVNVVSPIDAPADIILAGPSSRPLPSDLELVSPKMHMRITEIGVSTCEGCAVYPEYDPYFLRRTGPDSSGLYHYFWRLVTAAPGPININARAWTTTERNADKKTVTVTATTGGLMFGGIRSCYSPTSGLGVGGGLQFELGYYSQRNSTAVLLKQKRVGRHWVTRKVEREVYPIGYVKGHGYHSPYWKRVISLRFLQDDLSNPRFRVLYRITRRKRILAQGHVSRRRCPIPLEPTSEELEPEIGI